MGLFDLFSGGRISKIEALMKKGHCIVYLASLQPGKNGLYYLRKAGGNSSTIYEWNIREVIDLGNTFDQRELSKDYINGHSTLFLECNSPQELNLKLSFYSMKVLDPMGTDPEANFKILKKCLDETSSVVTFKTHPNNNRYKCYYIQKDDSIHDRYIVKGCNENLLDADVSVSAVRGIKVESYPCLEAIVLDGWTPIDETRESIALREQAEQEAARQRVAAEELRRKEEAEKAKRKAEEAERKAEAAKRKAEEAERKAEEQRMREEIEAEMRQNMSIYIEEEKAKIENQK